MTKSQLFMGLPPGRTSLCNLFSFYVAKCLFGSNAEDFVFPINLLQLEDDTIILVESLNVLSDKFIRIFNYSSQEYLEVNFLKTKYMHMLKTFSSDHIIINDDVTISAVDSAVGYT